MDYLEALAKLDPEAYGSLYNDVKRGAVEMTKELGKAIRRLLPNSPTEFY
jgi:DNA-directed RNA polymerase subunit F